MPMFEVEFRFSIRCNTSGYFIEAVSADEAEEKATRCITDDDTLNTELFVKLGGNLDEATWSSHPDTAHEYEVSEAFEVPPPPIMQQPTKALEARQVNTLVAALEHFQIGMAAGAVTPEGDNPLNLSEIDELIGKLTSPKNT